MFAGKIHMLCCFSPRIFPWWSDFPIFGEIPILPHIIVFHRFSPIITYHPPRFLEDFRHLSLGICTLPPVALAAPHRRPTGSWLPRWAARRRAAARAWARSAPSRAETTRATPKARPGESSAAWQGDVWGWMGCVFGVIFWILWEIGNRWSSTRI